MPKQKIESLIAQLDVQGDIVAEKVISELVAIGKTAVPALVRAAKDESAPRIRKWSLQALGSMRDRRAAPLHIQALDDKRMTVKLHALKGLARMKHGKAAKKITHLLKDPSGGIRVNALYALMEINDHTTLPQIMKCLGDSQWYVRQNACVACGKFKARTAKSRLMKIQKSDERKAVRDAATRALADLE